MAGILVIHGANLNLLGKREPEIYGYTTLENINNKLVKLAEFHSIHCQCIQSNCEGVIIDQIQQAKNHYNFIIINPAAYTHTSIGIRDAFLAISIPFIEVHISNPYKRESFRHYSYLSDISYGIISGMGTKSYELAINAAIDYCQQNF